MKKMLLIAFLCVLIDQITKCLIITQFPIFEGFVIIPGFFSLIRVHNTGAAWSILNQNTFFLIFISLVALIVIYLFFIKNNTLKKIEQVIYGILIGGVLGNLIDRIIRGYVIDFLSFQFGNYAFPVFNFADIFIVISALAVLVLQFRGEKNEFNKD